MFGPYFEAVNRAISEALRLGYPFSLVRFPTNFSLS